MYTDYGELLEAAREFLAESKYRRVLTRLAKNMDHGAYELTGFDTAETFGRHLFGGSKLPAAKRARRAIFKAQVDYEAAGGKAWANKLSKPKRGEGLQRAFIKSQSRRAKLRRQGYGPELDRITALKRLPVPRSVN